MKISHGVADHGFHEVVYIVSNIERVSADYRSIFGFETLWSGPSAKGVADFLGTEQEPIAEALIGDAAQGRGFIRLVQFEAPSPLMRDGAQPWDAGGIFDINIRPLVPIETMYAAMLEAGFNGYAPITAYNFAGLEVQEVVARGHDGVAIALIQRDSPPLEGFERVSGPASYVFNSTQTVRSLGEAKAFYEGALGWKPVFESEWVHHGAGDNCIGLPLDIARTHPLKAGIWHPQAVNEGSIECLEIQGVEGRDYAATCQPPNRGIAALRFPVSDLDAVLAAGVGGGAIIVAPPREIDIPPYGRLRTGALTTPWNARLEFYEVGSP